VDKQVVLTGLLCPKKLIFNFFGCARVSLNSVAVGVQEFKTVIEEQQGCIYTKIFLAMCIVYRRREYTIGPPFVR